MSGLKLDKASVKEIMIAINFQLFENGVISEEVYKKARDRLEKSA